MSVSPPPPPLRGPPPPKGEERRRLSLPPLGGVRPKAGRGAILALLLFAAPAIAQPVGDPVRGQQGFETLCTMCHATDGDGQGPPLAGVVGRKAATAPGFAYTDALKASGLTWTPAMLDKFLVDPMKFVPGTAMPQSVPDPGQRADIIAYLATLKP